MYGWRLSLHPTLTPAEFSRERLRWMRAAAEQGMGEAMFKVGRSLYGEGDFASARSWLAKGLEAGDADCAAMLAQMQLIDVSTSTSSPRSTSLALHLAPSSPAREAAAVAAAAEAVRLFEMAATAGASPNGGAAYSMYNLGVAHLYGYGGLPRNLTRAAEWFEYCGLPEGFMAISLHRRAAGKHEEADAWVARAKRMGFGSGGSGLPRIPEAIPTLHSEWPGARGPEGPPRW